MLKLKNRLVDSLWEKYKDDIEISVFKGGIYRSLTPGKIVPGNQVTMQYRKGPIFARCSEHRSEIKNREECKRKIVYDIWRYEIKQMVDNEEE